MKTFNVVSFVFLSIIQFLGAREKTPIDDSYPCSRISYTFDLEGLECTVFFSSNNLNYEKLTKKHGDILCDDGGFLPPPMRIDKIIVTNENEEVKIPSGSYDNLFFDKLSLGVKNNRSTIWLSINKENEVLINFLGGDASRSYWASLVLKNGHFIRKEMKLFARKNIKYIQTKEDLINDKKMSLENLLKVEETQEQWAKSWRR